MKFTSYLRDILGKIIIYLVFSILILAILLVTRTKIAVVIAILILQSFFGVILSLYDFIRKRSFYNEALGILQKLDRKYLLSETLRTPTFLEAKILISIIYETDKSMNEKLGDIAGNLADFRDYIELWVHEVKTPLSSLTLCTKNRDVKIYLKSIESYIDQALFYSKIDTNDKDYVIKKISLTTAVKNVIKNHKDALISEKIKIKLDDLDFQIYSDPKWLEFIINQIVLNAIKYHKANPEIQIFVDNNPDSTILRIRDNGIGIKPSEQKHIFKKGYTGTNDRAQKTSTGMGLYIAQKLAIDLGHQISVRSEFGKYTELSITFGHNDFYRAG